MTCASGWIRSLAFQAIPPGRGIPAWAAWYSTRRMSRDRKLSFQGGLAKTIEVLGERFLGNPKIRILYVTNTDWGLYNFRLPVLKALRERGFEASAAAAKGAFWDKIEGLDYLVELRHYRKSIRPSRDMLLLKEIRALLLDHQPDIVHFFSIKPVIFGGLLAALARIPVVVHTVSGLGSLFSLDTIGTTFLRNCLVNPLYRLVGSFSDFIFFQNREDRDSFIRSKIITPSKSGLVPGSGVDTALFSPQAVDGERLEALRAELKVQPEDPVVLLVSRMLFAKGVSEFVRAAGEIKKNLPCVHFFLVGPYDLENPSGIPIEQLQLWHREGVVTYLGRRSDVRDLLALSSAVVLPSYYREGIPKVLLEAASMGKPIVTTDTTGCREVVEHNKTGFLVRPRDPAQLAEAILRLIRDEGLRKRFGEAARLRAVSHYDLQRVIEITYRTYCDLLLSKGYPRERIPVWHGNGDSFCPCGTSLCQEHRLVCPLQDKAHERFGITESH